MKTAFIILFAALLAIALAQVAGTSTLTISNYKTFITKALFLNIVDDTRLNREADHTVNLPRDDKTIVVDRLKDKIHDSVHISPSFVNIYF